jgi:hypothetical protein
LDPPAAAAITKAGAASRSDLAALLALEGLPSSMSAEGYVEHAVRQLLVESVTWQAAAMAAGFQAAVDAAQCDAVACVGPAELAVALSGSDSTGNPSISSPQQHMDLRSVFRVVTDSELSPGGAGQEVGGLLWEVREVPL